MGDGASAGASQPAPSAPAVAASGAGVRGSLVLIQQDGSEGQTFSLDGDSTDVGRDLGAPFTEDPFLSPRHATFQFEDDQLVVKDLDSLNGVYVRIEPEVPVELRSGSIFRVGQEILRFETLESTPPTADGVEVMGSPNPGFLGRVQLVVGRDTFGNSYCVPPTGMHLGRERGDIIFPDDGYVSGLHCRIHSDGSRMFLTDVGSSNGTFTRVEGQMSLKPGSMILMGQQLFRAQY